MNTLQTILIKLIGFNYRSKLLILNRQVDCKIYIYVTNIGI